MTELTLQLVCFNGSLMSQVSTHLLHPSGPLSLRMDLVKGSQQLAIVCLLADFL